MTGDFWIGLGLGLFLAICLWALLLIALSAMVPGGVI